MRRLKGREERSGRGDQLPDLPRRLPGRLAVVEHDRQHRGAEAVGVQGLVAPELAVQERGVFKDPERHVRVVTGLELQQHEHVQPAVPEAEPPHGVAVAAAQVVAHVLARELPERGEVRLVEPPAGGHGAEQVLDHAREGEEPLVVLVVHGREGRPAAVGKLSDPGSISVGNCLAVAGEIP